MKNIPELVQTDGSFELLVDGKPFTMLAGELHNSSASSPAYMEEMVWHYLRELHLNTVLFPAYWECVEPKEGSYDFSLLDTLLQQADREGMRVVLLWFGLWKNGISSYVPSWVKQDGKRFFRARDQRGQEMDVISPLCREAVEADAKAFQKLLQHLQERDGDTQTVILVQVENEMGLLGSDRDYSETAEALYRKEIPEELLELGAHAGTWEAVFGEDAPEVFMEYAYAKAVQQIASAGQQACPLPMYCNAWIEKFPWRPGGYPSGGPIARFLPLWKKVAPAVSFLAPDVYTSDFDSLCREYTAEGNPLFIPEHRRDLRNLSHVFYAFGKHQALGFAPFGIEDFFMPEEKKTGIANPLVMKALNIDVRAWECEGSGAFLKQAYTLLDGILPMLREYGKKGLVHSFVRKNEHEKGTVLHLKRCDLRIDYMDQNPQAPKAAGFVIEAGEDEFYVAGVCFRFTVLPKKNTSEIIGILEYSEGRMEQGSYVRRRILNGDERYCMLFLQEPELQRVKWYTYGKDC